ncbi:MAG: hypothetical protein NVS4B9_09610 [Ktedonobacteraceae bacterium]
MLLLLRLLLVQAALFEVVPLVHSWHPVGFEREVSAGGRSLGWVDAYGDGELAFGLAAKDAARGRNISVVAPDGDPDVPLAGDGIICRVKAHPAHIGQQGLHPRVRRPNRRAITALALLEEIATDVAARNPQFAHQRDHNVREVLADAAPYLQRVIYWRVDARILLGVLKVVVDRRADALNDT